MAKWQSRLCRNVASAVRDAPFWDRYFTEIQVNQSAGRAIHLAVFVEPYLTFVLEGKKTVESRFSRNLCAPHGRVHEGDAVILKRSGGAVVGICLVSNVWFYELDPQSWDEIRCNFGDNLCTDDSEFWREREKASFATLMCLSHVTELDPITCEKKDRRGWVVLKGCSLGQSRCEEDK